MTRRTGSLAAVASLGVLVLDSEVFVETAASAGFGADCAWDGAAELFWGGGATFWCMLPSKECEGCRIFSREFESGF